MELSKIVNVLRGYGEFNYPAEVNELHQAAIEAADFIESLITVEDDAKEYFSDETPSDTDVLATKVKEAKSFILLSVIYGELDE